MFEEQMLTSGEKIKKIRKELKATQAELAGDYISKSAIGAIERGDQALTPHTANNIVLTIRKIAARRGIAMNWVTTEYLLENLNIQVTREAVKILYELKTIENLESFDNEIQQAEIFIRKYSKLIPNEVIYDLYELAYEKYYSINRFPECKIYILKCLDLASLLQKEKLLGKIIVKLVCVYIYLKDYDSVILYGKFLLNSDCEDVKSIRRVLYIMSKACKARHKIDDCIHWLKILRKNYTLDIEENLKVKILHANCIREKKDYVRTEKLYIGILEEALNVDSKPYIQLSYANLAELHILKNDYKKAYDYITEALKIEVKYENDHEVIPYVYYLAFQICLKFHNVVNIKKFFFNTIEKAENTNNQQLEIKLFKDMFEYCKEYKHDSWIIKLVNLAEEKIKNKIINDREIMDIFYYATYYFRKKNDMETFNYIYEKPYNLFKIIGE